MHDDVPVSVKTRLLDLHAHFPMHLHFPPAVVTGPPPLGKEAEFWAANMLFNFQGGRPRVSLQQLLSGSPGGIASVLYDPDDEFFHDARPVTGACDNLFAQIALVEAEVKGRVNIARNPADVEKFMNSGERFLFHCVEGAFGLGGDPTNVIKLAQKGVAYVTIAHLFFRGVAACENALPFVPDALFTSLLNPEQTPDIGLTALGKTIVSALLANKILVDVTHCNWKAQREIFDLAHDHGKAPVISSHNSVQAISDYPLNLSDNAIKRIAQSNGVVGIILSRHWLQPRNQAIFGPDGFGLVFAAIDHIQSCTGTYDHVAIGTDLDGFIQPIDGCQDFGETTALAAAIKHRYPKAADKILYGNAVDVLGRGWRGTQSDS